METLRFMILVIFLVAVFSFLIVVVFFNFNFVRWLLTWLLSNREEKTGLTSAKGHYNANGYLIHSDSDIQLDSTGSFKRFDTVDGDFKLALATTSLVDGEWNTAYEENDENAIPPQPLRPAPVPTHQQQPAPSIPQQEGHPQFAPSNLSILPVAPPKRQLSHQELHSVEKTSISPIPRPVSSINFASFFSQSPYQLTPPPTPSASLSPSYIKYPVPAMPSPSSSSQLIPPLSIPSNPAPSEEPQSGSGASDEIEVSSPALKRAISCDSICSDTSVALADLEEVNITGYLCVGLEFDSECCDLIVNILEAKDLSGIQRKDDVLDSYVRIFLLPDKEATIQTRTCRSSGSPSYKERFLFSLNPREQSQRSLCFHVYATDMFSHTLIGEGDIRLANISLRQPVTTWVTLTDTGQTGTEFGELMFSLSYLPTAERLTVVVVKARNLKFQNDVCGDSFVKVYLMAQGKKINKKRTSIKKSERSPIFNESMMFSVPAHSLSTIQLRLTVSEPSNSENSSTFAIGHVIVGAQASGRSLSHWNQMLTALRKPVAMWHSLRK